MYISKSFSENHAFSLAAYLCRILLPAIAAVALFGYGILGVKGIYWGLFSLFLCFWICHEIFWYERAQDSKTDIVAEGTGRKWILSISAASLFFGLTSVLLLYFIDGLFDRSLGFPQLGLIGVAIGLANGIFIMPIFVDFSEDRPLLLQMASTGWMLATLFSVLFYFYYIVLKLEVFAPTAHLLRR